MPGDKQVWGDFWSGSVAETLGRLCTRAEGLGSDEAASRLATYGPNRLDYRPRRRLLINFLSRFRNPLILILLAAAAVSAVTHEPTSFVIITAIVLLSVTLDFVQEHRAETAAEKLRDRVALRVSVLRDGQPREVPAVEIVPGDLIVLAAGDLVPADCRLIESRDLFVNEALLTGEPYPAEKHARDIPAEEARESTAPSNGVFMGSSVVSGTAKAIAVATGRATQLGRIAGELHRAPPPTAFALGIHDFGMLIVRLTVLLVLFVLLVNLLFERPLLESFLFALALAVGLTPELLPMVVSVTLAHGAIRMSRKDVIVKRLSAIHDLGSMDVLCSDKTGTLTEAHIKLIREVDLTGAESRNVLQLAYLNAAFETGLKSPLDEAILQAEPINLSGWRKLDEVPFDFERRRVSVLAERDGKRMLVVKGGPRTSSSSPRATRATEALRRSRSTKRHWRWPMTCLRSSAPRAFGCSVSPGGRLSLIAITPMWATRPTWCSPVLPPSSIPRRRAHVPRSLPWLTSTSRSRSSPATTSA